MPSIPRPACIGSRLNQDWRPPPLGRASRLPLAHRQPLLVGEPAGAVDAKGVPAPRRRARSRRSPPAWRWPAREGGRAASYPAQAAPDHSPSCDPHRQPGRARRSQGGARIRQARPPRASRQASPFFFHQFRHRRQIRHRLGRPLPEPITLVFKHFHALVRQILSATFAVGLRPCFLNRQQINLLFFDHSDEPRIVETGFSDLT